LTSDNNQLLTKPSKRSISIHIKGKANKILTSHFILLCLNVHLSTAEQSLYNLRP